MELYSRLYFDAPTLEKLFEMTDEYRAAILNGASTNKILDFGFEYNYDEDLALWTCEVWVDV